MKRAGSFVLMLTILAVQLSCNKSVNNAVKKECISNIPSRVHQKAEHKKTQKPDRLPIVPKENVSEQSDTLTYLRKKYAPLLSASQEDIKNLLLYKLIDEWMGTPYKYGGNTKAGADCSGFTGVIYASIFEIELARRAADIYHATTEKLKKEELKEGDLVFFDIGRRELSHVGVYLTNGKFVHASTSRGVVISDLEMEYYKKYFRCGGRIIN